MFDEVQVLNTSGTVTSTADTCIVTPVPSNPPGTGIAYGDDDSKLTDGAIIGAFGPQFADAVDGLTADNGGTVQVTWLNSRTASSATVWITAANSTDGGIERSPVTISWRQRQRCVAGRCRGHPSASCGPSPCARLTLPSGAQVTGVQATFPGGGSASSWYLISQLSSQ